MSKHTLSFLVFAKRKPGLASCLRFLRSRSAHVQVFIGERGDPFPVLPAAEQPPDVIISYLAPWVVPMGVLQKARVAAINFHPGPPEYPGIGCTNFALYNQERMYGVTAHHMTERVDTGPIIAVRRFPIHQEDSVLALTQRCYQHLSVLLKEVVTAYLSMGRLPEPQERWARKPSTRQDLERLCEVQMGMSPEEVARRVRATTYPGMPGAFIDLYGYRFAYVDRPTRRNTGMSHRLKGNYDLPKDQAKPTTQPPETVSQEFERRALERLGGSIAFVLKGKTFVWNGDSKPTGPQHE